MLFRSVLSVRKGQIASVYPDFFPEGVDANVVANFIDVVARDLSEVMAPLPAINCSAANSVNDRARKFADKRTRIASNYFNHSDLAVQMYSGADWYVTYGFVPFMVELDEEAKLPRIRIENPVGAYPEFDRYGRCVAFAKRYIMTLGELVSTFPEFDSQILGKDGYKQDLTAKVEMIRYYDKDQSMIYVPHRQNLVVSRATNPLGKMMVVVARRPSVDGELRGQFDDVLGIQLLRNRFALLAMEAAEKSGSLITAGYALNQGREVLAVPGAVAGGRNRGAHALLRDGAKIVESADDIVEELGTDLPGIAPGQTESSDVLTVRCDDVVVRSMVPDVPYDLDALRMRTGLDSPALLARLAELELQGAVRRMAGGCFVRLVRTC